MIMKLLFSFSTDRPRKHIGVVRGSGHGNCEVLDIGMAESAELLAIDINVKVHFLVRHNV
jgi:hypothetical protein